MRIEVSHESPLQFLEQSLTYNDYDYALVHLFETHPEYYKFFEESVLRRNRKVYLDNSIFELGESFDSNKYIEWIKKLKPTHFIVPDTLEDANSTVNQWINFNDMYASDCFQGNTDIVKIGVVQGRDWYELTECYKFMSSMADMIAISFDYSYYLFTGSTNIIPTNDHNWYEVIYDRSRPEVDMTGVDTSSCGICIDKMQRFKTGRQAFIRRLIDENIWNWNKPHHLLGCSLADEFGYYVNNNVYNITSVDTSNPIVAALQNRKYRDDAGLRYKPTEKLADLIDYKCSEDEAPNVMSLIDYNTSMFKKIIQRY